jgi:cytoskeletal protein CcmA (bactofilin family)
MAAVAESRSRPPAPVIAAGAAFEGLLHLPAPARIDGCLRGEVLAATTVWIGEAARVRARIEAEEVVVEGELEGEVRASRKIELRASARVTATLATPRLVLADGSFFEGRCETVGAGDAAGPAPSETGSPAAEAP